MTTREATHAGSWYTSNPTKLSSELSTWLSQVPKSIEGVGEVPVKGARIIIAPHAGYSYSGPPAAWAYASLDLSQAKRIFLLGPSHHVHLPSPTPVALSAHTTYSTTLGPLPLDTPTIAALRATQQFAIMSPSTDADEHSLEMHLPYVHHLLSHLHPSGPTSFPPLVPLLIGSTSPADEVRYGQLLAPYLASPENVFVISSDFCHWGARFGYTHYLPTLPPPSSSSADTTIDVPSGITISRRQPPPPMGPKIWQSIEAMDRLAMRAIETGRHREFLRVLKETGGNTVCGRHPIGVVMAGLESLSEGEGGRGRFRFVRYEQSSQAEGVGDSSVSYGSAFAVL